MIESTVEAVRRLVLAQGGTLLREHAQPGTAVFITDGRVYVARPAPWRVARQPGIQDAVRVVAEGSTSNTALAFGLLTPADADPLLLNDVATMRRLGGHVDPLSYVELLAEFYSGDDVTGPVVRALSATADHLAGELVADMGVFQANYPFVEPALVAPPAVHPDGSVGFYSVHYYVTGVSGAVDILQWTVEAGTGRDATWTRQYVARGVARPY